MYRIKQNEYENNYTFYVLIIFLFLYFKLLKWDERFKPNFQYLTVSPHANTKRHLSTGLSSSVAVPDNASPHLMHRQ